MAPTPEEQRDAEAKEATERVTAGLKKILTQAIGAGLKNTQATRALLKHAAQKYVADQTDHLPDHLKPRLDDIKIHSDGRTTATIIMPQPINFQWQEISIPTEALEDKPRDRVEVICRPAAVDWNWTP